MISVVYILTVLRRHTERSVRNLIPPEIITGSLAFVCEPAVDVHVFSGVNL